MPNNPEPITPKQAAEDLLRHYKGNKKFAMARLQTEIGVWDDPCDYARYFTQHFKAVKAELEKL